MSHRSSYAAPSHHSTSYSPSVAKLNLRTSGISSARVCLTLEQAQTGVKLGRDRDVLIGTRIVSAGPVYSVGVVTTSKRYVGVAARAQAGIAVARRGAAVEGSAGAKGLQQGLGVLAATRQS